MRVTRLSTSHSQTSLSKVGSSLVCSTRHSIAMAIGSDAVRQVPRSRTDTKCATAMAAGIVSSSPMRLTARTTPIPGTV